MTTTSEHIYNRIAFAANCLYREGLRETGMESLVSHAKTVDFSIVEKACERMKDDGMAVQTYGRPVQIAKVLIAGGYL